MRSHSEPKTVGWFLREQRKLDFDPPYQREGGAWSLSRKQLFIDSLFNGYDIPKIYLNEEDRNHHYSYSIVDGKQRVSTIISFLSDEFSLSDDFEENPQLHGAKRSMKFSDLEESQKQFFRDITLTTTIIRDASPTEIESLFSRLNDGEPLNNAEKRNALGGKIAEMIRSVADHEFFQERVSYANSRYQHRETAARLIHIELTSNRDKTSMGDLKKASLDRTVIANRFMPDIEARKLEKAVSGNLKFMSGCFEKKSPELTASSVQVHYVWITQLPKEYSDKGKLASLVKRFVEDFSVKRKQNNKLSEDDLNFDAELARFTYLSSQGTLASESILERADILKRRFLLDHPNLTPKDAQRAFTRSERYALWIRDGKECKNCGRGLDLEEMHADHIIPHAEGGPTNLENGQSLCEACNLSKSNK